MALFGKRRDIGLFNSIAKEFVNKIADEQVGYYKINLSTTPKNIYGESTSKFYNPPVLLKCLVSRSDQKTTSENNLVPDVNRAISYAFLRTALEESQIVPEVGDIIYWNGDYYEVDAVVENQLIVGKDPDFSLSESQQDFGSSFSLVCYTHYTRVDKLNIVKSRL